MKTRILLAWLIVVVPLAWGVSQSLKKAMPLFRPVPAAAPVGTSGR